MVATIQQPITAETLKRAFMDSDFIEIPATMDEYWQLVELPEYRLEYQNKHIVGTMSYGSTPRERVVSNLIFELRLAFDEKSHDVFGSNRPVYAIGCDDIFNPDVHLIEGELKEYRYDKTKTASQNPAVIIEVHSPGTKNYDLGTKLECYKIMPSVKQIIYINTDKPSIIVYSKTSKPNHWLNVDYTSMTEKVKILNRSLAMTKIYQKVDFEFKSKP